MTTNPSLCFNLDSANCECACVHVCGGRANTARGCSVQGLSARNIWVSDTQSWSGLEQQDSNSDSTCRLPTRDAGCTEKIHVLKYIQVWNENKVIFRSHGRESDIVSQLRKMHRHNGNGWTHFSAVQHQSCFVSKNIFLLRAKAVCCSTLKDLLWSILADDRGGQGINKKQNSLPVGPRSHLLAKTKNKWKDPEYPTANLCRAL